MKAKQSILIALCVATAAMSAQAQMTATPVPQDTGDEQYQAPIGSQPPASPGVPSQAQQPPAAPASSSQVQPPLSGFVGPVATLSQPEAKSENGVSYLCGGVGLDESDSMKRQAHNYDLMLTFAARDGSYLADANVDIADARGRSVLATTCGAPILLVNLPKSGTYRIRSEISGHAQTRTVSVSTKKGSAKSVVMVWPNSVANLGQAANSTGG